MLIDVSYRYRREELKGGRKMLDPETGIVTHELPEPEGSGIYKQHDPETGYTTVTGQVTAELPPAPAVVKTRATKNAKA